MSADGNGDDDKPEGGGRRIDLAAVIALLIGLGFVFIGLTLAISALPTDTKRGIVFIGQWVATDAGDGGSSAQDTLFILGFLVLSVGLGLMLAVGFSERYTFTYLGVSVGGTLGIVGIIFAGWKAVAEPPVFRYATIQFRCPNNTLPDGEFRLKLHADFRGQSERAKMEAGLLEISDEQYQSPAETLAGPDDTANTIQKLDEYNYRIPMIPGANRLILPTLLEVKHEVQAEYKAPEKPVSDDEDAGVTLPLSGRDLKTANKYQPFMKLDVVPLAVPGSRGFSIEWSPELLEATFYLERIDEICKENPPSNFLDADLSQ
jgi:hypothetical protein